MGIKEVNHKPLHKYNQALQECSICSHGTIRYRFKWNQSEGIHDWGECDWWLCAKTYKLPIDSLMKKDQIARKSMKFSRNNAKRRLSGKITTTSIDRNNTLSRENKALIKRLEEAELLLIKKEQSPILDLIDYLKAKLKK
jgi:hypothetical protein